MSLFNDKELKELEQRIKELESKIDKYNAESRRNDSILCESVEFQPSERQNCWADWLLPKEQTLEHIRTGFFDRRDRDLKSYQRSDFKAP